MGVSLQQLQKYETVEDWVTAGRLADVADALRIRVAALFEERAAPSRASALLAPTSSTKLDATILRKLESVKDPAIKQSILELILALPGDRVANAAHGTRSRNERTA